VPVAVTSVSVFRKKKGNILLPICIHHWIILCSKMSKSSFLQKIEEIRITYFS